MSSLAIKNLFHEKVRLGVTLTGIVFSIILRKIIQTWYFRLQSESIHLFDLYSSSWYTSTLIGRHHGHPIVFSLSGNKTENLYETLWACFNAAMLKV